LWVGRVIGEKYIWVEKCNFEIKNLLVVGGRGFFIRRERSLGYGSGAGDVN
jgi:hypothetical protein